ncbi:GNAT family N-acetyltransferase [Dongia sp.]|uniref:GNAT family N-acetyltransferase n=1 Tax=Dongia sp. TaxID=1977262 RepID=UPI0035AFAE69
MRAPDGASTGGFSLRLLLPSDAPQYRTFRLNNLRLYPALFRADAAEEAQKPLATSERRLKPTPLNRWQGAFDQAGILIGAVGFRREPGAKRQHIGQIIGLSVAPDWQGKGIATALMLDVIDYARGLDGLRQIQLTVTIPNPAAEQLYDRLGFTVFGLEQDALRIGPESHPKQHRQLLLDR